MTNFDSVDYFTDQSLVLDPHPYFDYLRSRNPMGCPINLPRHRPNHALQHQIPPVAAQQFLSHVRSPGVRPIR